MRATALVCLLGVFVSPASGQPSSAPPPGKTFSGRADVTAVQIVVEVRDAQGRVPENLQPADFEILENGEPQEVIGVELLAPPEIIAASAKKPRRRNQRLAPAGEAESWRILIFVDQVLSSTRSIRRAAQTLARQAADLSRLGTVEIMAANSDLEVVLAPTRDPRLIESALLKLARDRAGRDELRRARKRYLNLLLLKAEQDGRNLGQGATGSGRILSAPGARFNLDVAMYRAAREEARLLRRQQDVMLSWVAADPPREPRALFLINDGFDVDPREFYLASFDLQRTRESRMLQLQSLTTGPISEQVAQALSSHGWIAYNLALSANQSSPAFTAETTGRGRLGDIGGGTADAVSRLPSELVFHPLDPLRGYAQATGGEVFTGIDKVPAAVVRLGDRVRLTYKVERPPDRRLRKVEVKSRRPGVEVRGQRWVGTSPPEVVAQARARRLVRGREESGGLPVVAALHLIREGDPEPDGEWTAERKKNGEKAPRRRGMVQARLDLSPVRDADRAGDLSSLRVTLGVEIPDGETALIQQVVPGQDLARRPVWVYTAPVELPAEAGRVAVVIEDLETGGWGGALAALVDQPIEHAAALARAPASPSLPDPPHSNTETRVPRLLARPKALLLLPPGGELVVGKVKLEAAVADARVSRVDFYLDGAKVAGREVAPFEAKVDLGRLPRPREIEAVAFDAEGSEIGRDSMVINGGAGVFEARIVEPPAGDAVGAVDVEAAIELPPDGELEKVEISWNNDKVATLFAPPFRQRVRIPREDPMGYIGVRAFLADGTMAEDVVLLNGPKDAERLEVKLVELPVVVTDSYRRPVMGLGTERFSVSDQGIAQTIEGFAEGKGAPLTFGLVMDSSASMFEELRQAQTAAIDFLTLSLDPSVSHGDAAGRPDRAFVVDFDSEPRLAQSPTRDLDSLVAAVADLEADGYSALCDALVYSLVQLQRVRGKRALVVLSDGIGLRETVPYDLCLEFVRRTGVPLYMMVIHRDTAGGSARPPGAEKVEALAAAVGGRVFFLDSVENLGPIFRRINDELRSQYLLSYYPQGAEAEGWHQVEIEVEGEGLETRSVAGYFR